MQTQTSRRNPFLETGRYFLRLGVTGFGGPLAVVSQLERDLGDQWLTRKEFAEVLAAVKLLPGPVAFQMVTYLGYRRGFDLTGERSVAIFAALIAAIAFIFPAMVMILILAGTRATWISWTWTHAVLVGLQAAALGLILSSVVPLSKTVKLQGEHQEAARWMFALFGFIITLFKPELESLAILVCGVLAMAPYRSRLLSYGTVPAALVGISASVVHTDLFLICLKSGALVFGSALAIVPLLGSEFVDRLQWLSHSEFLEALSFGQMTPGPILITATYIGVKVAGLTGGVTATIGIFLVPFIHMTTWFPRVFERVAQSQQWKRFSFGAVSGVLGAVVASVIKLLEPIVLSALEIETVQFDRLLVTFVTWIVLPPLAFYFITKQKRPAWAVLLAGGAVSYALLGWF